MLEKLNHIKELALQSLHQVQDEDALQRWKTIYLGRSAPLMQVFDQLGALAKEERPTIGRLANEVKKILEAAYTERELFLHQASLERSLQAERLDVTLPGRIRMRGGLHPATQTLRRIYAIFAEMGFQVYRSREVETDEYNFELLNIPAYHPARDMWDTFHTTNPGLLLRTHTSPGQIHVMRERAPEPIRVILPGMVFRYEQVSARKETQFNQVEGLAVGENITFGDLKGTLTDFARRMFGQNVRTRFAPPTSRSPSRALKWTSNASCAEGWAAACAAAVAGWKSWAAAWSTRPSCLTAAMTPSATPAMPLAWAPSASRCSGTMSRISVIFGRMICGFWSNFDVVDELEFNELEVDE